MITCRLYMVENLLVGFMVHTPVSALNPGSVLGIWKLISTASEFSKASDKACLREPAPESWVLVMMYSVAWEYNPIVVREQTSMSRKGNCWDNAVAESFFKTIKYECLYRYKFSSYTELYTCIDQYMGWYNTKRIHSSLSYRTPLEMEIYLRGFEKVAA